MEVGSLSHQRSRSLTESEAAPPPANVGPSPAATRELDLRRKVCDSVIATSSVGLVDTAFAWAWGVAPKGHKITGYATLFLAGVVCTGIGFCYAAQRQYHKHMKQQRGAPTTPAQLNARKRYNVAIIGSEALGIMSLILGIAPSCVSRSSTISALYGASLGLNVLNVGFAVGGRYYARPTTFAEPVVELQAQEDPQVQGA
jgi:hypothetical protein